MLDKQEVTGSNPVSPTIFCKDLRLTTKVPGGHTGFVEEWLEPTHRATLQKRHGSNLEEAVQLVWEANKSYST